MFVFVFVNGEGREGKGREGKGREAKGRVRRAFSIA